MKNDCTESNSKDLNGFQNKSRKGLSIKITKCIRCGRTDIRQGVLSTYVYPQLEYDITWKPKSPDKIEEQEIIAILCKSCGHIELVSANTMIGQKVQRECPYCRACYIYRIPVDTYEKVVECQNCGKKFGIKIDDVLDEIEKEFEE